MLTIQDQGILRTLEDLRSKWNATALKLHLYSNTVTIAITSVLGDFTECTFAGYAAQDIVTWAAASVAAHVGTIAAAANTFTRSTTGASQAVKGYYVTDAGSTLLYWAEADADTTVTLVSAGDTFTVTPKYTNQSL